MQARKLHKLVKLSKLYNRLLFPNFYSIESGTEIVVDNIFTQDLQHSGVCRTNTSWCLVLTNSGS